MNSSEHLEATGPLWAHEEPAILLHRAFYFPEAEQSVGAAPPLLLTVPAGEPYRLRIVVGDEIGFGVESWSAQVRLTMGAVQALDDLSDAWPWTNEVEGAVRVAWSSFDGVALMRVASSTEGSRVVIAHSRTAQPPQAVDYFELLLQLVEERLPDSWVRSNVTRTRALLWQPDPSHRR